MRASLALARGASLYVQHYRVAAVTRADAQRDSSHRAPLPSIFAPSRGRYRSNPQTGGEKRSSTVTVVTAPSHNNSAQPVSIDETQNDESAIVREAIVEKFGTTGRVLRLFSVGCCK